MVLTRGDDYPIHQTSEPIAYAGTDRNFYDRYFFNGYAPTGEETAVFALAFGVYPHLNVADAAFVTVRDGVQIALHASRIMDMERMALAVGPISIEVVVPLQSLRLRVSAPEQGVHADILFTARAAPIEEPRFTRRIGPRAFMDYTRLTQNGRYTGWIEIDGVRRSVDGHVGTRDRSWGVRPIGARDAQELAPAAAPQFFWLWAPVNFEDGSLFFHTNDDAQGRAWNRHAVWSADGAAQDGHVHFNFPVALLRWQPGTRQARRAVISLDDRDPSAGEAMFSPLSVMYMLGLGYGHPKWGHGLLHGALAVEREDLDLAQIDMRQPQHLHVQALCDVRYTDRDGRVRDGRGVLEQLVFGPHAPSGFAAMLDMAP
jgi:hypothetical protein